jgi:phosphoadenosine phosphosulfate reductase
MSALEEITAADGATDQRGARAAALAEAWEGGEAIDILRTSIEREFNGKIALVSSFGAESAVLLHMVSQIDKNLPVIFIDTEKHFAQTTDYRDLLVARVGLTNVQSVRPDPFEAGAEDPKGDLWKRDPDSCCNLRKVRPNERALAPYDAWISGRKRHHGKVRAHLPVFEHDGLHYKVNPLVAWTPQQISEYMTANDLPSHPLVAEGFPSIGCWPCTSPSDGTDARAGRWAGSGKDECGIHRPAAPARRLVF